MPGPNPTAGRTYRPARWLVIGAILAALVCETGCGDGSSTSTGPAAPAANTPSAKPGEGPPQKAPGGVGHRTPR
jgi:hypothetical protein